MKNKSIVSLLGAAALCGATTVAMAGAYGEAGEPQEVPRSAPPVPAVQEPQEEQWSFVVTPQVWMSHIDKNGFSAPGGLGHIYQVATGEVPFSDEDSGPLDNLDVQWGTQLAAQKGRWSIAVSFQTAEFDTKSDVMYRPTNGAPATNGGYTINNGDRAASEYVNTTRYDFDIAASYLFPNVIPNRLDLTLGGGVKVISGTAVRHYENLHPIINDVIDSSPAPYSDGAYCIEEGSNTCAQTRSRVKTDNWAYGVVIPLGAIVHLTDDSKWLVAASATPFLGANTRDDRGVVFQWDPVTDTVDSQDGTKFAYGVTSDMTLRHALTPTLSVYAGMRLQYFDFNKDQEYFAYGPLMGISARFGGGAS